MSGNLKGAEVGMTSLCAFRGLAVLATVFAVVEPAAAQFSMRTGSLGGSLASRPISRPLGGFLPTSSRNRGQFRAPLYGYPFAYSVWVPDYYDYLNAQNQYPAPYAYGDAPPAVPPASQQPVIINQYFGAPSQPPAPAPAPAPEAGKSDSQAPGDPIGTPANYYLIAYKNHAVYTALAYWLEDKTLHYVTTQNTHNQASLDLIDLTLTKSLNEHNDVPFAVTGQ
jgi:hypothetical protein